MKKDEQDAGSSLRRFSNREQKTERRTGLDFRRFTNVVGSSRRSYTRFNPRRFPSRNFKQKDGHALVSEKSAIYHFGTELTTFPVSFLIL